MTRAKDRLYLVHAHHRSTYGVGAQADPSRFLAELPGGAARRGALRGAVPRGGGDWPRGTDDDGGWLPVRLPLADPRRVNEPLRPINLPDLSRPGPGRAASWMPRASASRRRPRTRARRVDLGSGHVLRARAPATRSAPRRTRVEGRRPRAAPPLRRRDRRQQPDREGRRGGDRRLRRRGREAPDRGVRRPRARLTDRRRDDAGRASLERERACPLRGARHRRARLDDDARAASASGARASSSRTSATGPATRPR